MPVPVALSGALVRLPPGGGPVARDRAGVLRLRAPSAADPPPEPEDESAVPLRGTAGAGRERAGEQERADGGGSADGASGRGAR